MRISGIYKIVNKINGKYYIGSSKNIYKRWSNHKLLLKQNIHPNKHFQSAWNQYGRDNFEFNIIEKIDESQLLIVEQKYLDECKENPKLFYNISYCAESPMGGYWLGKNHTKKSILKTKSTCTQKHINASSQKFIFFHNKHGERICRMIDLTYEFNLDGRHVGDVCRGTNKSHQGWKCLGKV
jgi:group I intron endonuclease